MLGARGLAAERVLMSEPSAKDGDLAVGLSGGVMRLAPSAGERWCTFVFALGSVLRTATESPTDRSHAGGQRSRRRKSADVRTECEGRRPYGRALGRGHESRPLPVLPVNRDLDRALCTKEPYLNTGVATVTGFAGESRYGSRLVYKGTISQYRSRDRYRFCR
jgi:hypothetical protein